MNIYIIIAGGSGNRMHQDIPKQFLNVNEQPVIIYTLKAFQNHPEIDTIAVVCIEGWEQVLWAYANQFNINKLKYVIAGGDCGQASIRNGVFELENHFLPDDIVLIHDAIRPMVSAEIISDNIRVAQKYGNAITVIPCAEAMMQTEDGVVSIGSYPRDRLKRTQTPQAFRLGQICDLHRRALEKGITNSVASCTLMIEMGEYVYFLADFENDIKHTTVEEIDMFKEQRSDWLKIFVNDINCQLIFISFPLIESKEARI